MELLENQELIQSGAVYDLSKFSSNSILLKKEVFSKFAEFNPSDMKTLEG
jgi:hypothetical protein